MGSGSSFLVNRGGQMLRNVLVHPWNKAFSAGAIFLEFRSEVLAQQAFFCLHSRDEHREHSYADEHTDPRPENKRPAKHVNE